MLVLKMELQEAYHRDSLYAIGWTSGKCKPWEIADVLEEVLVLAGNLRNPFTMLKEEHIRWQTLLPKS